MTKKYTPYIILVSILIIIGIVFAYMKATSAWAWISALEVDEERSSLVVRSSQQPEIEEVVLKQVFPEATIDTTQKIFKKSAIILQNNKVNKIIGIPYIKEQIGAVDQLKQEFGTVGRLGPIVYAQNESEVTLTKRNIYKNILKVSLQRSPILLVSSPARDNTLEERLVGAAYQGKKGSTNGSLYLNKGNIKDIKESIINFEESQSLNPTQTNLISGPMQLFDQIPAAVLSALEEKIVNSLGFERTTPPLLTELSRLAGAGALVFDPEKFKVGIMIENGSSAEDIIEGWLKREVAHHHPIRKAFNTPDGKLGYEILPDYSIASPVFPSGGCANSILNQQSITLCRDAGKIFIANDPHLHEIIKNNTQNKTSWSLDLSDIVWKTLGAKTQKWSHVQAQKTDQTVTFTIQK